MSTFDHTGVGRLPTDRRTFLKIAGVVAAGLCGAPALAAATAASADVTTCTLGSRSYRGTSAGKIFVSDDNGRNWTLHTNFGRSCPIGHLDARNGHVVARVDLRRYSFELTLQANGRNWQA